MRILNRMVTGLMLLGVLSVNAQTTSTRVPSAKELYLEGNVSVRRSILNPFNEDHYGEALDLSERRPVVNVDDTVFGAKYSRPGSKVISNFFHNGQFYIARIPDRGVRNTYFQLSYFPPQIAGQYIAAHSLLRFEMEQAAPIELVAPMPDTEGLANLAAAPESERLGMLPQENIIPIRNAAISAEAQWTQNDPHKAYDLNRGRKGAFTQIVRMVSMTERLEEALTSGNPANQFRLPFCNGEGDRVLSESIRLSESDGIGKLYDTLWYNCTTLAFDILEGAGVVSDRRLGFIRNFMQRRVPVISPAILTEYGGTKVTPLSMDPSLARETAEAYRRAFPNGGEVCPEGMAEENCRNVRQMIDLIVNAATSGDENALCRLPETLEPSMMRLAEQVMSQQGAGGDNACEQR
jgi:hypothetical protein